MSSRSPVRSWKLRGRQTARRWVWGPRRGAAWRGAAWRGVAWRGVAWSGVCTTTPSPPPPPPPQLAGAGGNGSVVFAQLTQRRLEWENFEVTLIEPKLINVQDASIGACDELKPGFGGGGLGLGGAGGGVGEGGCTVELCGGATYGPLTTSSPSPDDLASPSSHSRPHSRPPPPLLLRAGAHASSIRSRRIRRW